MANQNPFPESPEKKMLRVKHLQYLGKMKLAHSRQLVYFGLPSAEMRDIEVWRPMLGKIIAIERDSDIAETMFRTATRLGVRQNTIVLEMSLHQVTRLMAMKSDHEVNMAIQGFGIADQRHLIDVHNTPLDVINLDLCGGFLYHRHGSKGENIEIIKNLIDLEARHRQGFLLIVTFNLRDTGAGDYETFISETLNSLQDLAKIDTTELRRWYVDGDGEGQPPNLRRLRFCVPLYLLKEGLQDYQIHPVGYWYYKTFYHASLYFEPRIGTSVLGSIWPPIDEVRTLLNFPMNRLEVDSENEVVQRELPAPQLP